MLVLVRIIARDDATVASGYECDLSFEFSHDFFLWIIWGPNFIVTVLFTEWVHCAFRIIAAKKATLVPDRLRSGNV